MTQALTLGDINTATQLATHHHDGGDAVDACEQIGRGDHRTVYVDYTTGVVYKIGRDAANRREHEVLTAARLAGADYAPVTALYEVTATDLDGDDVPCTVLAMPYLPEDGSVDHVGVVFPEAADFNEDNVVAHGGRLWLIDAGGM